VAERQAGTLGDLAVFSFHHTKNISCGEGGVLVVNNPDLIERARVVHQNGTNRHAVEQEEAQHYEWEDLGSSFAPSDLAAALLSAQLERADEILVERRALWNAYQDAFEGVDRFGVRRPTVPEGTQHNGHIYYLMMPSKKTRTALIASLAARGIQASTHYVSLDRTPGGRRYGRACGKLAASNDAAECIVRLPLWMGMGSLQGKVVEATLEQLKVL
jgi:dTDP-4-amino-4,6-dideoxygalactose transaminase